MRLASLLAAGALVLHKLHGLADAEALEGHGHSYLPLAVAIVTVLLLLACASFARELWQAWRGRVSDTAPPSFRLLWLVASAALLGTFALQEWIEGWVTPGHPANFSHAVAHVGWLGPLLAAALGAVVALLVRATRAAVVFLARRHHERRPPRAERGRWPSIPQPAIPRLPVLAGNRAGRAPPSISFA